jgi:Fe-S-cluster containining protein
VHSGGQGILWESPERARLVVQRFARDDDTNLGRWAILDLGKSTFGVARRGPLRGLVTTPVPRNVLQIVRDRAVRDSIHEGPLRTMSLDCRACGSCCRDNEVILMPRDRRRFKRAAIEPVTTRRGGRVMLRLLKNGACSYLGPRNACGIYESRPDACRDFPPGSECCLFAREEELGITDGHVERFA